MVTSYRPRFRYIDSTISRFPKSNPLINHTSVTIEPRLCRTCSETSGHPAQELLISGTIEIVR